MGDAASRKNAAVIRLRQQLKKKKEALADQFEYKMYMVFHFKDQVSLHGNHIFLKAVYK